MTSADLKDRGFQIFPGAMELKIIDRVNESLERSYERARQVQLANKVDQQTDGTIHHLLAHEEPVYVQLIELLCKSAYFQYIKDFFGGNFILNSYGGLKNLSSKPSYVANIHRDIRFFSGDFPLMLNLLIMLDDFTLENGATYLLDYSHKVADRPSNEDFYARSSRAVGKKGDIMFFNSNLWHAAGINKTNQERRAITITFTKPFMKQQLDYPRAVGYDKLEKMSPEVQQLIGYFSRTPATLEEWYQKPERRFYRPGQD